MTFRILLCAVFIFSLEASGFAQSTTYTKEEVQQLLAAQKQELLAAMDERMERCSAPAAQAQSPSASPTPNDGPQAQMQADRSPSLLTKAEAAQSGTALSLPTIFQHDVGTGTTGSTVGAGNSRAEITTSTANSKATLQWNFPWSQNFPTKDDPALTFTSGSITFSAPVNKNGTDTKLATLDGLADAFTLTLGIDGFYVSSLADPATAKGVLAERFVQICKLAGIADAPKAQCDDDLVQTGLQKSHLSEAEQKQLLKEFEALGTSPSAVRLAYGAKLELGQQPFDVFNSATLKKVTMDRSPWSATAYFGVLPPETSWYLGAGMTYQHEYKASKSLTLCPSSGTGPTVQCQTGSFSSPEEDSSRLVFLEARHRFFGNAVSLRLTHDYASGDSGVDLPIYLWGDGDGAVNGGVRFGWTNDEHFIGGIFVGSGFNLYPFDDSK